MFDSSYLGSRIYGSLLKKHDTKDERLCFKLKRYKNELYFCVACRRQFYFFTYYGIIFACLLDEVVVVGIARGGKEALVQVQNLRPRVILPDLFMPGLSIPEDYSPVYIS